MKKISVYVKGDRNSTAYYRIYQYLDKIDNALFKYHPMMSSCIQMKYMPISGKNIMTKICVYIHIYFRMLFALLYDLYNLPDCLIIHRRIISRYMPISFYIILLIIKKNKVGIIWDFDDNILENKEVSSFAFDFYSRISDKIVVTHKYLCSLISPKYRYKVDLCPTTDGDMCVYYNEKLTEERKRLLKSGRLNLVWVATSVNLPHLENIVNILDEAAYFLMSKYNFKLYLKVVCDLPLTYQCKYLIIDNIKWSRSDAIKAMVESHVGIMPLMDTAFTRGKGGFKLIQYLSIGLPCIGSAVGYNNDIITKDCGFLVDINNERSWISYITKFIDIDIWENFSVNSFLYWSLNFSYKNNLEYWKKLVHNVN